MRTVMTAYLLGATLLLWSSGCSTEGVSTWSSYETPEPGMSVLDEETRYDNAVGVLEDAISDTRPQVRANAIEASHPLHPLAEKLARQGLVDENRGVRFVAAMTIGRLELREAAHLVRPLLDDGYDSVRAAAIFALYRCEEQVDLTPLAEMLKSDDPEVRGNAIFILGEIGNPSAAPMIRQIVGENLGEGRPATARLIELQAAEALARLGDKEQLHVIRGALFLPTEHFEFVALACQMCGRLEDYAAAGSLKRLIQAGGKERRPAEVRLASAAALGELGEAVPAGVASEYIESTKPAIRAQVAWTLGRIGTRASLPALEELLNDPDTAVSVAAAGAIVRIHTGK